MTTHCEPYGVLKPSINGLYEKEEVREPETNVIKSLSLRTEGQDGQRRKTYRKEVPGTRLLVCHSLPFTF